MSADLSIYLVTDRDIAERAGHTLPGLVAAAVSGGVTAVQIREKRASARAFLQTVVEVAAVLPAGVALIVNDRIDVFLAARELGVAVTGVHLGQSDLPAESARRLIGADALLGVSAATKPNLLAAAEFADYAGAGPIRSTATKPDATNPIGFDGFAHLATLSSIPLVAIGGIGISDAAPLRASGAAGVAVVSAICAAADPEASARELRTAWGGAE